MTDFSNNACEEDTSLLNDYADTTARFCRVKGVLGVQIFEGFGLLTV